MTADDEQMVLGLSKQEYREPGVRRSLTIFIACLCIATALVIGGRFIIQARAAIESGLDPEPPVSVSVLPVSIQAGYEEVSRHIGLIESARRTDLAFEANGTLVEVMVNEGDRVSRGTPIARLDTRTLNARRTEQLALRDALLSDLEHTQRVLQREQTLADRDLGTDSALDEARFSVTRAQAMINQADASLQGIDVQLDKAVLRAPFDAEVGRQSLDEGSSVQAGVAVASLFEWDAPVARIGLPVANARALIPDSVHNVLIDGTSYPAVLLSRRRDVSARTRTVDVRFELLLADRVRPAFGQTVQLQLRQFIEKPGYNVPVTALSEGEAGLWSLLLAVPDEPGSDVGRVVREHVDLLQTDGGHAYVIGDFSLNASIIQVGTHRVVTGQRVRSVIP